MMNNTRYIKEKMFGCLYGQAIGDALGLGIIPYTLPRSRPSVGIGMVITKNIKEL